MKLLILILIFTSCSSFNLKSFRGESVEEVSLDGYREYQENDYIDHLISFEKAYKKINKRNIIRLGARSKKYLKGIIKRITSANELFFNSDVEPTFNIVKASEPFHFSLPGRRFFISTGLLRKYIKNEDMLYSALIYELVRSEKKIYGKTIIIPTGTLDTNRILSILRLGTSDKVEIHKWSYYLLNRAGISSDSYLSWLQVKNRNSLDFSLQLGDIRSISREEALFKAFLIENEKDSKRVSKHRGSSRDFYRLLNEIKA